MFYSSGNVYLLCLYSRSPMQSATETVENASILSSGSSQEGHRLWIGNIDAKITEWVPGGHDTVLTCSDDGLDVRVWGWRMCRWPQGRVRKEPWRPACSLGRPLLLTWHVYSVNLQRERERERAAGKCTAHSGWCLDRRFLPPPSPPSAVSLK